MDWNNLKDTVSNMTLYDVKAGVRKVQNGKLPAVQFEMPVIAATLNEIMPMIYRRFTEKSAEEWRQIYKALQLLEFLIKHGSERVIDDARGHITLLKMLRQFHFIDQNGKDQGINVRNRAKELAELLSDVERIRTERKKARATKNKYTGVEGGMSLGGGFSSGSGSRYGGFGSESGGYGGYSGGVYGDGGGFGGQESNDYGRTQAHNDKFEEYDEFDDERPAASSSASRSKRPERTAAPKAEPPKKKEPEVDLFSFDDPAPSSMPAPAVAPTPSNGSGLASLSAPSNANDDDEFDDFQSAAPAPAPAAANPLPPPLMTANSATTFAAPQPVSAPQQANMSNMVSMSSMSPAPSANYSAFSTPAIASPATQAKSSGYQPSGPNYFSSVQAAVPQPTGGSFAGTPGAGAPKAASAAAKPGAAGGDAFGALWSQASTGVKKSTPTAGPALGQLAKEKSSAGIWGAPAPASSASKPAGGNHGLDDLLG
ncbi:ENTH domain-containing protein C794.11c [Colletotrichum spaethianum]|uniref:ENTH domain-containing protein C794.11c n=1 Tax=Colletotrichum spaethianum TaxID=700344 RepID=A0AA37L6U7_9PEZI|nr:ENTH domain-containing protein C794.11c [Colletotrichum spaethianum]GKT42958.1 ENTH domain-containing protein C794.11c [Colletotrichum spaethianum]